MDTILPDPQRLDPIKLVAESHSILAIVLSKTAGTCCGILATRIHSRYQRILLDLPWHGSLCGCSCMFAASFVRRSPAIGRSSPNGFLRPLPPTPIERNVLMRALRWLGRPCTVLAVEPLSPRMRLVRFGGESLRHLRWAPGREVQFVVDSRSSRHYTPSRYDPLTGEMEILFYLPGHEPGSAWAARLTPGQPSALIGPGFGSALVSGGDWHLLLGDETALGLFVSFQTALPSTHPILGAVEMAKGEEVAVRKIELPLAVVQREEGHPGEQLTAWLKATTLPEGLGQIYLVGHAQTIRALRTVLLENYYVPRERIKTKPYWADGKRGL